MISYRPGIVTKPVHRRILSIILVLSCLVYLDSCANTTESLIKGDLSGKSIKASNTTFNEIWAYLLCGEEAELKGNEPITDLCYFSAELTYRGELEGPKIIPSKLKIGSKTRVHLVVANIYNTSLIHFAISPEFPVRRKLIDSIVDYSRNYDGIQIDFEGIHPEDRKNFISFLSECKQSLRGKMLSVALRANTRLADDVYDYEEIGGIVDRVFIMAYDEHWNTSNPGPIASVEWCGKVADCVKEKVHGNKVVMGLPFYGRAWQDVNFARSLKYRNVEDLAKQKDDIALLSRGYPSFSYNENVKVSVYFENRLSIIEKLSMYKSKGIKSVGFWRIGQNPHDIWDYLSVGDEK